MTVGSAIYPDLRGRVAAVTGGGRGLGKAMAMGLAANGVHVLIGSICSKESEEAAAHIRDTGGSAIAKQVDIASRDDCTAFVQRAVHHFGSLDIMMCNAAISISAAALDTDVVTWQRTIDVDLTGAFNSAVAAGRQMVESGSRGSIVFSSSTAAQVGFERLAAYGAAKAAVNQLVRSLALEWGQYGIRVNAIAPGWTSHRMEGNEKTLERSVIERGIARTPLRRVAEVAEIVAPAIFLASEAASFITGSVLTVDGGYAAA